jgi:hypothetical protein
MGCGDSRDSLTTGESLVYSAERSLGLHTCSSRTLDNAFSRVATGSDITQQNLELCLQSLKGAVTYETLFYKHFLNHQTHIYHRYSALRLKTLGILLGNSIEREKCKLLFQCYDRDANRFISEAEMKYMIDTIVLISLDFIPDFAMQKNRNDELKTLGFFLKGSQTKIVSYFMSSFNNKKEIRLKMFQDLIMNTDAKVLLKPEDLRNFAIKNGSRISAKMIEN